MADEYSVQRARLRHHAEILDGAAPVWRGVPDLKSPNDLAFTGPGEEIAKLHQAILEQYQEYCTSTAKEFEDIAQTLQHVAKTYGRAEAIVKDYLR
ncbi:hypothetical protein [Actinomadura verrucosospora]|uniref:hypothetical protein n=1 Tax=Actinomadura verrucosospora TaxID=46165 RepID=UPI0015631CDF|nr:hypothetical protein [Actinomadura verrucosospora]